MRKPFVAALAVALLPFLTPAPAGAAVVCNVTGSVLDATGQAVPGADVLFMNDSGNGGAATGADGSFGFATVCGSATVAIVWQSAPRPGLPADVDISGTTTVTDGGQFALRLPALVDATLKVTDAGGAPQVNAAVYQSNLHNEFDANAASPLAGAGPFIVHESLPLWHTDAAGVVHFQTFPDSDMVLTAAAPAGSTLQPADFTLNASTAVSKTVVLPVTPPGTLLAGSVRDSAGRPVPNAYLYRSGTTRAVYADVAGQFRLYGPSGAATLGVNNGDNDVFPAIPATPDVPTNYRVTDIPVSVNGTHTADITLPPVAHIKLTVLRYDGTPVSYATMTFGQSQNAVFDSDPAVVLPGTPARRIEQSVDWANSDNNGGIAFNVFRTSTPLTSVHIEKSPDEKIDLPPINLTADQNITVQLPKPPDKYLVTGTLLDADGNPVLGAEVISTANHAFVDDSGHFSLPVNEGAASVIEIMRGPWLPVKNYRDQDTLPDDFSVDVPIQVDGPTTVTLSLPRALHLTVRTTDPDTRQPLKDASLRTDDGGEIATSVPVGGAAGPGSVWEQLTGPPTNADGVAVYRTWPFAKAQLIEARAQKGSVYLKSMIRDLEMSGDKTLNLALGSSGSPITYRPPKPVTSLSAVGAPGASATTAGHLTTAAASVTASLHWTAPRSSGGMPITGYRITAKPGGRTVVVGKKATSAKISGLDTGTSYTFTVQAMNKIGRAKNVTVRLDVAAPRVTVTGSLHRDKAWMAWTGTDDASGIASYDVRVHTVKTGKPFGPWTRLATKTSATTDRVKLAPGTTTCISVRARDRAGHLGAWSAPSCVSRPA